MVVSVTEEDIRRGKPLESCGCPIARALLRKGHRVRVHQRQVIFFSPAGEVSRIAGLPSKVTTWIEDFDTGGRVEAFSFALSRFICFRRPFEFEREYDPE